MPQLKAILLTPLHTKSKSPGFGWQGRDREVVDFPARLQKLHFELVSNTSSAELKALGKSVTIAILAHSGEGMRRFFFAHLKNGYF
jgi:hypothetical protein